MNDFDGLPKSTYYYRKKPPPKLSFAVIAREFEVTRQCIYDFAKRYGITDLCLLRAKYWLHRQRTKTRLREKYSPCYAEYEIIALEPCEKDYIRPEKQSQKDKRQNIIRLLQEEPK
jgi:predicted DNA-binding protein YlxM (UPF0122 family)